MSSHVWAACLDVVVRGRTEGVPQRRTPSRPWAVLVSPKPPEQTAAKSGDFDEGKRRVYEAALAEPDVLHFPPLNLPPQRGRRTLNPSKRKRESSTKAGGLKRTLPKVHKVIALWTCPLHVPLIVGGPIQPESVRRTSSQALRVCSTFLRRDLAG